MASSRSLLLAPVLTLACLPPPPPLTGEETDGTTGGGSTSTSADPPAATSSGTTDGETATTTSGPEPGNDSSDSSDGGSESTDTGEPPACCHAGCPGTCVEEPCAADVLGPPSGAEALGLALVGDYVVWSTGWGKSLELSGPLPGTDDHLLDVPANSFVTLAAGDDTHVYFLDYGGPTIRRATVPDGAMEVVSQVPDGEAGFGNVAMGPDHVYFAMEMTGGIWRAAKDLSNLDAAELVGNATSPRNVAIDDTYVYWANNEPREVRRIAIADIGTDPTGELVYTGALLSGLAIDDQYAYIGDSGNIVRVDKLGTDEGIMVLASGQVFAWDIEVDDVHAYWTAANVNEIRRTAKDGSGKVEPLATTTAPRSLELSCDRVFWTSTTETTMQGRLK